MRVYVVEFAGRGEILRGKNILCGCWGDKKKKSSSKLRMPPKKIPGDKKPKPLQEGFNRKAPMGETDKRVRAIRSRLRETVQKKKGKETRSQGRRKDKKQGRLGYRFRQYLNDSTVKKKDSLQGERQKKGIANHERIKHRGKDQTKNFSSDNLPTRDGQQTMLFIAGLLWHFVKKRRRTSEEYPQGGGLKTSEGRTQ